MTWLVLERTCCVFEEGHGPVASRAGVLCADERRLCTYHSRDINNMRSDRIKFIRAGNWTRGGFYVYLVCIAHRTRRSTGSSLRGISTQGGHTSTNQSEIKFTVSVECITEIPSARVPVS